MLSAREHFIKPHTSRGVTLQRFLFWNRNRLICKASRVENRGKMTTKC